MGMYEREPNFEERFHPGDRMVVMGMQYIGEINTSFGGAQKSLVKVVTRESYPTVETYSVLGAGFANLAQRARPADFPHVAEYVRVPLPQGRDVKRFLPVDVTPAAWKDGDDGPPVDVAAASPSASAGGGSDDPGF